MQKDEEEWEKDALKRKRKKKGREMKIHKTENKRNVGSVKKEEDSLKPKNVCYIAEEIVDTLKR